MNKYKRSELDGSYDTKFDKCTFIVVNHFIFRESDVKHVKFIVNK